MNLLLIIRNSLSIIFESLPSFIFSAVLMVLVLIVGYIIGRLVYKFLTFLFDKVLELDNFLKKKKLNEVFYGLSVSKSIATLAKWYIYLVFFVQSLYLFSYRFVWDFAYYLWNLIPNIYIGLGALIIFLFIGEIAKNLVRQCKFKENKKVAEFVKGLFIIPGIVIFLDKIGLEMTYVYDFFKYMFLAFAIGFGAAFGFLIVYQNKEKLKL